MKAHTLALMLLQMVILAIILIFSPLVWLRYLWAVFTAPERAWAMARGFDRVGNAATNGADIETISSRAARAQDAGRWWAKALCRALDWVDCDHCKRARGI